MKMKRRKFIKQGLGIGFGAFFVPQLLSSNSLAKEKTLKRSLKPEPSEWKYDDLNIAWIGHSTVLINFFGTIILTDPVLFRRIGLYFFGATFGPGRYSAPALEIDEIPKPDIILLSHAHLDHMDYKTLFHLTEKFKSKIDCITAFNTKDVIEDLKWKSLAELDWGNHEKVNGLKINALEVDHFGWRFPWEKDRSRGYYETGRSYNAYIVEKNGVKILFGGDTAFTEKLKPFENENINIAIMPIGAYNPWKTYHCNPEEALIMASNHLGAEYFLPIHCNTFKQGFEPVDEPLRWLTDSKEYYDIEVGINSIGETFKLEG